MADVGKPAYLAKLVRGQTYYLGPRRMERDAEHAVTEAEKAHLEEHAVDQVTVEDHGETRQKFVFRPIPADVQAAKPVNDGQVRLRRPQRAEGPEVVAAQNGG